MNGWLIDLLLDFKLIRISYSNIQIVNLLINLKAENKMEIIKLRNWKTVMRKLFLNPGFLSLVLCNQKYKTLGY